MRVTGRTALAAAAVTAVVVALLGAAPAQATPAPTPPGPVLGALPDMITSPGGSGFPALGALVRSTCNAGAEMAGAEWYTLPSGDLGSVYHRAQGVQLAGRSPSYLTAHTALVDWSADHVLACGGDPFVVTADTPAAIVVWYDAADYHANVDGCGVDGGFCNPPQTQLYAGVSAGAPDNDTVAHARAIATLPFSDSGDSSLATADGPTFPDWCTVSGALWPNDYGTVWWRWTATATGWVSARTAGSTFSPVVGVAEQTAGGLDPVTAALDHASCPVSDFHVVAGHTYVFAVHSWTDEFFGIRPLATGGAYSLHLGWVTTPGAPTSLSAATTPTGDGVTVAWAAPAKGPANEAALTGYHVSVAPSGSRAATPFVADVDAGVHTATLAGLSTGTTYTVTVRARSVLGLGPAIRTVFTIGSPVIVPSVPSVVGTSLAVRARSRSMTLGWNAPSFPGGTLLGFRLTRDGVGVGGRGPVAVTVPASARSFTFAKLRTGTLYHVTVAPLVSLGGLTVSGIPVERHAVVHSRAHPPGQPLRAVVTTTRTGTLTLSWKPPTYDGQAPITSYVITRDGTDLDGHRAQRIVVAASARSVMFTRLAGWTTYTFHVAARNATGTGSAATTTGRVRRPTPGAPTVISVLAGTRDVTLRWTSPQRSGATPVSGYVVRWYRGTSSHLLGTATFRASGRLLRIRGSMSVSYSFTVTAVNAAGAGTPSPRTAPVSPGRTA